VVRGASPYTGRAKARHTARQSPWIAAALALTVTGCSTLGLPFGPDLQRVSTDATGAIPVSFKLAETVAPSDWEIVRNTISTVPIDKQQTVEWNNAATGSNGALTVAEVPGRVALCRSFSTTVSDAHGVRGYRGQACRESDGRWQLQGISADDAKLS
jgi:hypothetical protein